MAIAQAPPNSEIPAPPNGDGSAGDPAGFDVRRPFTRADAVAVGIDPRILRTSRFRRIFRGVYVASAVPETPALRARAALALHPPDAFISHTDAAREYGLPVPDTPDTHVTVFHQVDRRRRPGIRVHVATSPARVVTYRNVRLSHPFRMFLELAGVLSLVDLVVVGDAMVKVFDIAPARLVHEMVTSTDHHAVAARRAARYVRAGVDSPMETRLRMLIVLAGFPEPVVNKIIRHGDGEWSIRLDLCYPHLKLIIEYDGWQHRLEQKQWSRDLQRREWLDSQGWRMIVINSDAFYGEPLQTLHRIRAAMVDRGQSDLPLRQPSPGPASSSSPSVEKSPVVDLSTPDASAKGDKSPLVEFSPTRESSECREGESNPYVLADRRV